MTTVTPQRAEAAIQLKFQNLIGGPQPAPKVRVKSKTASTILHLRSGDTIPCTVTGIDEEGVTFTSKVSDTTFIKHESIKVLELESEAPPVKIAKAMAERKSAARCRMPRSR